jgi:hypothetical protein
MSDDKPDPFEVVSELVTNAIQTAKVFGENRRISNLVAGSVSRFMADMDDGDALVSHALGYIDAEAAGYVPELTASLQALSAGGA